MSAASRRFLSLLSSLHIGIEASVNIEFGSGGRRTLRMHIARPADIAADARLPAVVYVFGGGWARGDPEQGTLAITALALRGFVAASFDYRLSDEAVFPAQLEDCKCAVRFLRAHAAEYGIDPDRIGAFGLSAGGHLAALLATTAGMPEFEGSGGWAEQRSDVQAVVDWYGPSSLMRMAVDGGFASSPDTDTARLLGGAPLLYPARAAKASPTSYVSASSAPMLLAHGTRDTVVPLSQSELLHRALVRAGAESELVVLPGRRHGLLGSRAISRSFDFLRRHLMKGQA